MKFGDDMHSSIITIDIRPESDIRYRFYGSVARGWFGSLLKCGDDKDCRMCDDIFDCPYYMVFKEKNDIKPYALLSVPSGGIVRTIIRIHGERRRFVPKIVQTIHNNVKNAHFGGSRYSIEELKASDIDIPDYSIGNKTDIIFVSPLCLKSQNSMELIPSFKSIIKACVRSYNRLSKYYNCGEYPFRVDDSIIDAIAPVVTYDIRTVRFLHQCMDDRQIPLEGVIGSVTYDTSKIPPGVGRILKAGELLQIGKHTTYGLGGLHVKSR